MRAAAEPEAAAQPERDCRRWSAVAKFRAVADTARWRWDRKAGRPRSSKASHHPDKSSNHRRCKCGCIGDIASFFRPRFLSWYRTARGAERVVGRPRSGISSIPGIALEVYTRSPLLLKRTPVFA